jgi:hypothetical protein
LAWSGGSRLACTDGDLAIQAPAITARMIEPAAAPAHHQRAR